MLLLLMYEGVVRSTWYGGTWCEAYSQEFCIREKSTLSNVRYESMILSIPLRKRNWMMRFF